VFFLVFFQLRSLDIYYFNLAVEGFLDGFIVFYLLVKVLFFLVN
jgi:hypothetical protein